MIPATEGAFRLQMKSKSSIPCTARGCKPLEERHGQPLQFLQNREELCSLDEASCSLVEEQMFRPWAQRSTRSDEATDVIICRRTGGGGRAATIDLGQRGGRCQGRAICGRGRHDSSWC